MTYSKKLYGKLVDVMLDAEEKSSKPAYKALIDAIQKKIDAAKTTTQLFQVVEAETTKTKFFRCLFNKAEWDLRSALEKAILSIPEGLDPKAISNNYLAMWLEDQAEELNNREMLMPEYLTFLQAQKQEEKHPAIPTLQPNLSLENKVDELTKMMVSFQKRICLLENELDAERTKNQKQETALNDEKRKNKDLESENSDLEALIEAYQQQYAAEDKSEAKPEPEANRNLNIRRPSLGLFVA